MLLALTIDRIAGSWCITITITWQNTVRPYSSGAASGLANSSSVPGAGHCPARYSSGAARRVHLPQGRTLSRPVFFWCC